MKQTILSLRQSELLENLIVKYGQTVTTADILNETKTEIGYQQTKNLITKLVKNGWLIRVKKGLYIISDLSNRGFLSLPPYIIASLLAPDSYTSFQSALQYHGMFDQLTAQNLSIVTKARRETSINGVSYSFIKTKKSLYFGWQEAREGSFTFHMAEPEKALIDLINFNRSEYSADLVIEKIKEYKSDLNLKRLTEYLKPFPKVIIKIFGFIFDLLKIDSSGIRALLKQKGNIGTHFMFAGSKKFNAKWRLYYNQYFDKYL